MFMDKNTQNDRQALEKQCLEVIPVQNFKSFPSSRVRCPCVTAHRVSVFGEVLEKNKGRIQG